MRQCGLGGQSCPCQLCGAGICYWAPDATDHHPLCPCNKPARVHYAPGYSGNSNPVTCVLRFKSLSAVSWFASALAGSENEFGRKLKVQTGKCHRTINWPQNPMFAQSRKGQLLADCRIQAMAGPSRRILESSSYLCCSILDCV